VNWPDKGAWTAPDHAETKAAAKFVDRVAHDAPSHCGTAFNRNPAQR
jgi:hypothetical protein